jgi:ATP-dependent Lon protease
VKEKLLAAYRAGIKTILIPKENKKDLEDVPAHVLAEFEIITAENVEDVLKVALLPKA